MSEQRSVKDSINILLNRRKELIEQRNKIDAEYDAIEKVLIELHHYKEKEKNEKWEKEQQERGVIAKNEQESR